MTNSPLPPWAGIPATGPLLRPAAAAEYLGVSRATFYKKAAGGVFPKATEAAAVEPSVSEFLRAMAPR